MFATLGPDDPEVSLHHNVHQGEDIGGRREGKLESSVAREAGGTLSASVQLTFAIIFSARFIAIHTKAAQERQGPSRSGPRSGDSAYETDEEDAG